MGGPAAIVCGATVKTNAIVVPRPEAHRTVHSMQTIRKPPRSDNIRKRNRSVGEETGPTFPKGRTSAVSFRSRKRTSRAHAFPAHEPPSHRIPVYIRLNRTMRPATDAIVRQPLPFFTEYFPIFVSTESHLRPRDRLPPDDRFRFSSNIFRIFVYRATERRSPFQTGNARDIRFKGPNRPMNAVKKAYRINVALSLSNVNADFLQLILCMMVSHYIIANPCTEPPCSFSPTSGRSTSRATCAGSRRGRRLGKPTSSCGYCCRHRYSPGSRWSFSTPSSCGLRARISSRSSFSSSRPAAY